MPKDSHAFLGWTNRHRQFPTSLSEFEEQEAELQESFLYLYG
jgi:PIN domain nuclease of toxin-antitoxin system